MNTRSHHRWSFAGTTSALLLASDPPREPIAEVVEFTCPAAQDLVVRAGDVRVVVVATLDKRAPTLRILDGRQVYTRDRLTSPENIALSEREKRLGLWSRVLAELRAGRSSERLAPTDANIASVAAAVRRIEAAAHPAPAIAYRTVVMDDAACRCAITVRFSAPVTSPTVSVIEFARS
jgi:hypothetical protein